MSPRRRRERRRSSCLARPAHAAALAGVVAGALLLGGCESCARGRGEPGAAPIERLAPTASASPGGTLPDPCRGTPLPADQHYVAPGLCARVVATHQGSLRQLTFAPNGDLFAVTIPGSIRRYRDRNGDGRFTGDEIVEWASTGGNNGHNCEIDARSGYLYAGSQDGVKRWKYGPEIDQGGPGEDVVVGQSGGGNHPYHPLHVYDGVLYVDSGSYKNSIDPMPVDYDGDRAVMKRFDLAKLVPGKPFQWRDGELFVRGVRNATGFTRDAAGRIYAVVSGLDDLRYQGADLHPDNPGDEVVRLEAGKAYGYPFCFPATRVVADGRVVPPGTMLHADAASQNPLVGVTKSSHDDAWCAAHAEPPISLIQAHASALSLEFFEGPDGALPARWRGGAFIALHGSWDRNPSTGYKIVWLPFDAAGTPPMPTSTAAATTFPYEIVFGGGDRAGPRDGAWGWHTADAGEDVVRPVGVAVSPIDGALYVSSDNGSVALTKLGKSSDGNLYRIGVVRP